MLCARAKRVIESSRMTTSRPCSTSRLAFSMHHVGYLDVAVSRLVEGGGDDLRLDVLLHLGHFLGPLVDQQHDEDDLRVILADGVGQLLQQDRLARPGRRHDQAALALADGREEVDDPHAEVAVLRSSRIRSSG